VGIPPPCPAAKGRTDKIGIFLQCRNIIAFFPEKFNGRLTIQEKFAKINEASRLDSRVPERK
jgi:hypothetical protein